MLVVPRAGVLAATEMVPVPSVAEIESRKEGFESREWEAVPPRAEPPTGVERQAQIEAVDDGRARGVRGRADLELDGAGR